jgi:hypothetical protein
VVLILAATARSTAARGRLILKSAISCESVYVDRVSRGPESLMISHSPIHQRARDLCTCGHQHAAHQEGKLPKVNIDYPRIFNTTCALCYCGRFKKDTNRILRAV